jgi:hypothetical protein
LYQEPNLIVSDVVYIFLLVDAFIPGYLWGFYFGSVAFGKWIAKIENTHAVGFLQFGSHSLIQCFGQQNGQKMI